MRCLARISISLGSNSSPLASTSAAFPHSVVTAPVRVFPFCHAKTAPVGRWMRTLPSHSNCSISTRMRAISKFLPPESEFRWTAPKPLSGSHDAIVWPWPRSDVNLRGSGLRATGTLIRNRRPTFSRILIEWHGFLLNSGSRGGQQWSLPNFVPSSLKWTPSRRWAGTLNSQDSMRSMCSWRHDVHLRQPQAPEGGLHRARGAKGNYRYDAAHHLVRKSRSASKTAPTGWLSELGEITRRGHTTNGAMNYHGLFPMLSMVRARRPTPPEPTDRPPRSWRAIHRRAIPLTRRLQQPSGRCGDCLSQVPGSVSLPRLWFETAGRTDSATASTSPSPTVSMMLERT